MSAWSKLFNLFRWENSPSSKTPLGATLLQKLNIALDGIDNRVIELDTKKMDLSSSWKMVQSWVMDVKTGVITVTLKDGTVTTYDTALEKVPLSGRLDTDTNKLIFTNSDGSTTEVDISKLVTQYEFVDTDTIGFAIAADGKVSCFVKDGSIGESKLSVEYLSQIKIEVASAQAAAAQAVQMHGAAASSAEEASISKGLAYQYAQDALKYRNETKQISGIDQIINDDTDSAETTYSSRKIKSIIDSYVDVLPQNHEWYHTLFYYSQLYNNSVEDTANLFARYDIVVYGYSPNSIAVTSKMFEQVAATKIFGYVAIGGANSMSNDTMEKIKTNINRFAHIGGTMIGTDASGIEQWTGGKAVYGIFLDEYGFDYTVSRERQNEAVKYCHDLGFKVFANSWGLDSLFSTEKVSMNPNGLDCELNSDDFILFESTFFTASDTETKVRSVSNHRRIYDYTTSDYFKTYGCKPIVLDYVSGYEDDLTTKKILTFGMLTGLLTGAYGYSLATWGVNSNGGYIPYVIPDILKILLSTKVWNVENISSGVYKAAISGYVLMSTNTLKNGSDITLTDARLIDLYVTQDGSKVRNAWDTISTLRQDIEEKVSTYNDKDSALVIARPDGHAGILPLSARADHSHPASKFIRMREDEWILPKPGRTNLVPDFGDWERGGNTISKMEGHDIDVTANYVWAEISYSGWDNTDIIFAGKTIEFGVQEFIAGDPNGTKIELLIDGGSTGSASIWPNTVKPSIIEGFTTTHTIQYTFDEYFHGVVKIRVATYSSVDKTYSLKGFYAYDVHELDDKSWYTNMVPDVYTWNGHDADRIAKLDQVKNQDGTLDIDVKFSGQSSWSEMMAYFQPSSLANKTIEIGMSSISVPIPTALRFSLTAYDSVNKLYKDLAIFYVGVPQGNSPLWKTQKICKTVNFPEDGVYTEIRLRFYAISTEDSELIIRGLYMYDVDEEVNVLADELVYSKTVLEFCAVKEENLPAVMAANRVYMTEYGCMYITNQEGKIISLGTTPSIEKPNGSVVPKGFMYFDIEKGRPYWYDGTAFVAAGGKELEIKASLDSTGWVGNSAPYSYTIENDKIGDQDVEVSLDEPTTEQADAYSLARILTGKTMSNSLILKAYGVKPSIAIPILIRIGG